MSQARHWNRVRANRSRSASNTSLGTQTYLTLAYFDITQTNLPNPVALPNAPSQQEGEASITGFEFEGVTTFETALGDLKLDAALTLLDTEDANGLPFSVIPDEQASLWAEFRPTAFDALRIGAGVRYVGERESSGLSLATGDILTIVSDSYTLADLLVAYELEDWSVALNVRNLFDEEYYGSCLARGDCFPGEERTVNLRVARRF
jgi:iron complex outermembrane receptor protein